MLNLQRWEHLWDSFLGSFLMFRDKLQVPVQGPWLSPAFASSAPGGFGALLFPTISSSGSGSQQSPAVHSAARQGLGTCTLDPHSQLVRTGTPRSDPPQRNPLCRLLKLVHPQGSAWTPGNRVIPTETLAFHSLQCSRPSRSRVSCSTMGAGGQSGSQADFCGAGGGGSSALTPAHPSPSLPSPITPPHERRTVQSWALMLQAAEPSLHDWRKKLSRGGSLLFRAGPALALFRGQTELSTTLTPGSRSERRPAGALGAEQTGARRVCCW